MATRPLFVALLVSAAVPACIPPRDNPFDPTRAPTAVIAVRDRTLAGGDCGAVDQPWPQTWATANRRCLLVDATGSEDPQETALAYRFRVEDEGSPSVFVGGSGFLPSPIGILDSALVFSLPVDRAVRFVVEARDEEGAIGSADVPFVKLNNRPVAPLGSVRFLPTGGFPWAPGGTVPVSFDGSDATDADVDPLQWCWTVNGVEQQCGDQRSLDDVPVPTDASDAFVVELRVSDGNEMSAPGRFTVLAREPSVWFAGLSTATHQTAGRLERLDTGTASSPDFSIVRHATRAGRSLPATVVTLYRELDAPRIGAAPLPLAAPTATPVVADDLFEGDRLAASAESGVVWHVGKSQSEEQFHARRYVVTAAGDSRTLTPDPSLVSLDTTIESVAHAAVGGDGTLWLADTPDGALWEIAASGEPVAWTVPASLAVTSLAARPGTDEVWAVLSEVDPAPGAGESARIVILEPGREPQAIALPSATGSGLAFVDGDAFWIDLDGLAIFLMSAVELEQGTPVLASVLAESDAPGIVLSAIADPQTGHYVAVADEGGFLGRQVVRVLPSGSFHVESVDFLAQGAVEPLFFDDRSIPWYRASGEDLVSTEAFDGIAARTFELPVTAFAYQAAAPSPATGGVWTTRRVLGRAAIVHVDPYGSVDRVINGLLDEQGTPKSLEPRALRASPDGRSLYLVNHDDVTLELLRLDLDTTSDDVTVEVLGSALTFDPDFVLDVSPPGVANPVVWIAEGGTDPQDGMIRTLPLDGSPGETFPIPGISYFFGAPSGSAAASPVSGDLCVVSRVPAAADFEVRFLGVGGVEDFVESFEVLDDANDGYPITSVAWWTGPASTETCWISAGDANPSSEAHALRVFRRDGTLVHHLPIERSEGFITAVSPLSEHAAWISIEAIPVGGSGYESRRALVEFPPIAGSSSATLTFAPRTFDGVVMPAYGSLPKYY